MINTSLETQHAVVHVIQSSKRDRQGRSRWRLGALCHPIPPKVPGLYQVDVSPRPSSQLGYPLDRRYRSRLSTIPLWSLFCAHIIYILLSYPSVSYHNYDWYRLFMKRLFTEVGMVKETKTTTKGKSGHPEFSHSKKWSSLCFRGRKTPYQRLAES